VCVQYAQDNITIFMTSVMY